MVCSNYSQCKHVFCYPCLKKYFHILPIGPDYDYWQCFVCSKTCHCEKCQSIIENKSNADDSKKNQSELKIIIKDGKVKPSSKISRSKKSKKKLNHKKRRDPSSDNSGSLYIPSSDHQKKVKYAEGGINKTNQRSLRKSDQKEPKLSTDELLQNEGLNKEPEEFHIIENMPSPIMQRYPTTGAVQNYIQYYPYEIPYMLGPIPQQIFSYNPRIGRPLYATIPYPFFGQQINPINHINRRENNSRLQSHDNEK